LRWSPDGGLLAAGGNRIRVWNTETWELIRTIELVGDWSFELEWSPNSQYIFHGGGPDGLYIDAIYPDLGQDNNLQTPVYRIAKSGDGRIIAVTYRTTNIEFFDGLAGELISTADLSPIAPRSIALSPSGDRLVWLEANSRVAVYNTDSATNTYLSGGPSFIDAVVWNPVNELAGYIGSISATFHDAKTGMSYSHLLARDTPALISVAWSPDGQQLAASHSANPAFDPNGDLIAITLWGDSLLAGGFIDTPQMVIKGRGGGMIEWSPDGERFAVLERDGFLVYDVATDSIEEKVIFDANILDELRWSPDGSLVATGGTVIRIWDTETWEEVGTISTYGSPATSHQWSADGQHIFHNGGHDGLYMDALPPEILTTPAP
jgi:WD40 repeat protein